MGKKQFCFFQTAETGNRTPDSGVKGSGANHYPRAPAPSYDQDIRNTSTVEPTLAQRLLFSGLRVCQYMCSVGGEYKPTLTQCLLNVGPVSGQYPFSPSQYFMLAGLLHIAYTAPMPFKCWPASYTMARHRINARYTDTLPAIPTIPARCIETKLG